jgi:hypothetical protein
VYPMHRAAVCQDANSAAMEGSARAKWVGDAGPVARRDPHHAGHERHQPDRASGNASEASGREDDRGGERSCRGSALLSTSIWQGRLTIYPEATGV